MEKLVPTILKVTVGATIAFAMEISEFLVVTYTSSLTLSISGIFKEMCILVLAVEVSGDVLSPINVAGLALCLLGIIGHITHKVLFIKSVAGTVHAIDSDFESIRRSSKVKGEHDEPLLEEQAWPASEDSDFDSNVVLFEVLQRRDVPAKSKRWRCGRASKKSSHGRMYTM
ncbi:solute carrier family 35 member C2-like [Trichoplusia ni]|uniref:Solute carrier family 35 member C2-like n=1 Tax=Trichoplusia ni TaxID=7111 RepID=A0A7E5W752_TRINI|nr:solute carrier family 35 member C2-like [Trichoplusia ni]